MKIKRTSIVLLAWLLAGFCFAPDARAQKTRKYKASSAVAYATKNYNVKYGYKSGQNPFFDFGNNCANFVSQSLVAGLSRKSELSDVYAERYNFTVDRGTRLPWYFISEADRAPAWAGAKKLYEYAVHNRPKWKGLHFNYVTHDSPQTRMKYRMVKAGDVVFADWESDGVIDHVMIVTKVYTSALSWYRGYDRIRVTYQSNNVKNRGLEDINRQYNYQVSFHVYRPIDYTETGR